MAPIKTDVQEPPVFTERVSTPYAYTKPQRESTAPSPAAFLRSPEPITPPRSTSRPLPSRDNSSSRPKHTPTNNVFDDSDVEPQDTARLRTERKPARYSFVKSDLQREHLRTNLQDTQPRPPLATRDSGQRRVPTLPTGDSSGSSKGTSYPQAQSPRSSSSSLNSSHRKTGLSSADSGYPTTSRPSSRPDSPLQRGTSPKLPPRLRQSPPSTRPASRGGGTGSTSPFPSSTSAHVPVTETDWHSTYPPVTANDRSRPPSRYARHETMPIPTPRIDVKSPSPVRPRQPTDFSLPYPDDDRPMDVFMPSEEHYQFDHSTIASPRQTYLDSPWVSSSSIPASPHVMDAASRQVNEQVAMPGDPTHARRTRSNSVRSQSSQDERQEQPTRKNAPLDLDKPLPSCPRSTPTARYDDWYSLQGYDTFNVCPSCYEGVFAGTPFAVHFSQTRQKERLTERLCDFSSPWMRLAWLLTIKQRRQSLDLLYMLAAVADTDRPCPGDRELGTDRIKWYGIPDQRDGVHVANFSICASDKKMIEAIFPTMHGYFTKLSTNYQSTEPDRHLCSLRTSSRRFPTYLDLLVELDAEAQSLGKQPNINRFVQLARDNAFKGECAKDKTYIRKPWHFITSLPEFTVCEECYDELVWPAIQSKTTPSSIPRLFNKAIQLVPTEDPDIGSSCCLYSPRMRRVWDASVENGDLDYLKKKVVERKRAEMRLARERKGILHWMVRAERGSGQWIRARNALKELEREWTAWE
ncbi:hypothetical protein BKA66DRAFT_457705 [Pyrenochaeta sp. MPI-SDFR-AT-0127]|nr:hypothetical protein BKA66DRAFT_457705 [Pyrenochaeta sp. MPI-SDFR-AT-0127]